jgi:hypothetical protein
VDLCSASSADHQQCKPEACLTYVKQLLSSHDLMSALMAIIVAYITDVLACQVVRARQLQKC